MVSKVFEFGDTIFAVLQKKPLILLQNYHIDYLQGVKSSPAATPDPKYLLFRHI